MSLQDKIDYMNQLAKCLQEELAEAKQFWDSANKALDKARDLDEINVRR